jgi:D-alanyl-D-alanine carboxypeptidase
MFLDLLQILLDNDHELKTQPQTKEIPAYIAQINKPLKRNEEFVAPIIEAKSALVIDLETNQELFNQNPTEKLPIASITKLMTALIILEEHPMEEIVTITKESTEITGSKIWLFQDEKISIRDLLYAILIHSANDAAHALAIHNGGSVDKFVEKMNQKAQSIGLQNTNFSNPIGFDDPENFSNAYDLSLLGRHSFRQEFIRQAATINEMTIISIDGKFPHELKSTNLLLQNSNYSIKGLKTGSTDEAGQCLITVAELSNGRKILTVILNSQDRFLETKKLIDWAQRAYNQ